MFSGNTGNTQDYRTLLVAKITAMHTPTDGPLVGRPVYEWIEQQISMTGSDEDVPSPRKGTYTSGMDFDNILVDVNDASIPVGTYIWARMKGSIRGSTIYETVWATNITSTPADCRAPLSGLKTTECVYLVSTEGGGGTYPFSVTGVWSGGASGWVASEQITTGDGLTTITLVRGNGYYYIKLVGQTTTWYGEDIDCSDGARIFAADGDPTDSDPTLCADHTFRVSATCTACPDVCAGWYCLSNLGTVAYAATCGDLAALEAQDNGDALGTEAYCTTKPVDTLPLNLSISLSTSSAIASSGVNGATSTLTRGSTSDNFWTAAFPGLGATGYIQYLYLRCIGGGFPYQCRGYASIGLCPAGEGAGDWLNPVASAPTPWALVFEIPICFFSDTPVTAANVNDIVTVVISEV